MTTLTIELEDAQIHALQERAATLGMSIEELVRYELEQILQTPNAQTQDAIAYLLQKNADLYRRLA